jgi:hypothetical protein
MADLPIIGWSNLVWITLWQTYKKLWKMAIEIVD